LRQAGGGGRCQGTPAGGLWGVVARRGRSAWERPVPGEGLDGRTPPAQDTGGSDARTPTARRGIADQAHAATPPRLRDRDRGLNVELLLACWGDLKQAAASGVAGGTWHASAANRPAPVEALGERLQPTRDRAQLLRRRSLPQGNGHERPLGLPVLEDQRLQAACASLLQVSDAPEFRACRDGDRPARGAGEAVRALTCDRPDGR
jgi:RNA-directed DNA polymerase